MILLLYSDGSQHQLEGTTQSYSPSGEKEVRDEGDSVMPSLSCAGLTSFTFPSTPQPGVCEEALQDGAEQVVYSERITWPKMKQLMRVPTNWLIVLQVRQRGREAGSSSMQGHTRQGCKLPRPFQNLLLPSPAPTPFPCRAYLAVRCGVHSLFISMTTCRSRMIGAQG